MPDILGLVCELSHYVFMAALGGRLHCDPHFAEAEIEESRHLSLCRITELVSISAGFRIQAVYSRATSGCGAENGVSFLLAGSRLLSLCQAEAEAVETLPGEDDGVC